MKRNGFIKNIEIESIDIEKAENENINANLPEIVIIGHHSFKSLYPSPYPKDYFKNGSLYICNECLGYCESIEIVQQHICSNPHENINFNSKIVYDTDSLRIYKISGDKEQKFCENICLLGKLFIETKTLYLSPVSKFDFYVLYEKNKNKNKIVYNFVGYFSKEPEYETIYNLSCLLILPIYQEKGYGKFLISISYELSKRDKIYTSSPEIPLSVNGLAAYMSYWKYKLFTKIKNMKYKNKDIIKISKLVKETGIRSQDIVKTMCKVKMHVRKKLNANKKEKNRKVKTNSLPSKRSFSNKNEKNNKTNCKKKKTSAYMRKSHKAIKNEKGEQNINLNNHNIIQIEDIDDTKDYSDYEIILDEKILKNVLKTYKNRTILLCDPQKVNYDGKCKKYWGKRAVENVGKEKVNVTRCQRTCKGKRKRLIDEALTSEEKNDGVQISNNPFIKNKLRKLNHGSIKKNDTTHKVSCSSFTKDIKAVSKPKRLRSEKDDNTEQFIQNRNSSTKETSYKKRKKNNVNCDEVKFISNKKRETRSSKKKSKEIEK